MNQTFLKELLEYNPLTGLFTWRERPLSHFKSSRLANSWNKQWSGKVAGHISPEGYLVIRTGGVLHKGHRLAFTYMTGSCPKCVDHINGHRADNRWENLRAATRQQNTYNSKVRKNSKSGCKGVYRSSGDTGWVVSLSVSGVAKYIGIFADLELAELVAREAREHYHGEFARHE